MITNSLTILYFTTSIFLAPLAQDGTITGQIANVETGQNLIGAVVLLETTQFAASTNIEGEFSFANVPEGEYVLQVTYIGYKEYSSTINIEEGRDLAINIELEPIEGGPIGMRTIK